MKTLVRMCFSTLWIVAVLSSLATAQVDRSFLGGTVTDPNGDRIPGAMVTAVQPATGLERKTETSSQGTYMLDSLPIGRYDVTFSKPGFSQARFEQVELGVGEARVLNVQLHIGAVAETITVTAPLVRLDTTGVIGAPVERAELRELPLNGRNWASLTTLVPGAIDTGPSDQHTVRFVGHGRADNAFLFDGVDAGGIYNAEQKEYVRLAIPLDSIAEFQVQSQNFGADVGMTAGGQISAASLSGTNSFHGSLFDYYRSDVFDSRSPFDGPSPDPFLMNQFGAALGGPIVSNRTFFYANYEGLRQRLGQVQIGLAPSPSFVQQAEAQSPALTPLLSAYPAGTSSTSNPQVWNYVAGANQVDNEDSGMIRIDQHFTDRTTAFLRYSADEAVYSIPTGALNALADTDTKLKNGIMELLHVFSPSLVNEAKFGVNQVISHTANISGLPFYSVSVSNLSSLTGGSTADTHSATFSYIDDLSWMKGRHVLKFGVAIRRIDIDTGNSASGTLTYVSLNNFLGNIMDSATYTALMPLKRLRKTQFYGYAADQYRITPNLTINMGLRYTFFNVYHEVNNLAIPFDFATCGGYCPVGSPFQFPRHADFDPRLGVAWARGKTVLRAGAGIYRSDGEEDDQDWPISNDIEQYTLSSVTTPELSYPINPFLQNTVGIVTPRAYDRNHKDMYAAAWNASVERSFPGSIVGTVSYVGNKGTHIITTTYENTVNPLTGVQPYPQFGVIRWRGNDNNSTFHALQMNVRRAFQKGWLLAANYMWSHSIDDDSAGGGDSDKPQNVFCRSCEKASGDYDERQVFNVSAVYELPFGAGKRLVAQPGTGRAIFGGWQLSGIGTARTGLPVNVVINRKNSTLPDQYSVSGSERPDLVPGVSLIPAGGQTPNNWINPAAFTTPAPGTYGDAGRNLVRAPGLWQVDLAMAKKVSLTDKLGMQFRVEAFNVFNRAQFGSPQANLSSPLSFGVITTPVNQGATGSGTPREFQFALRFLF